MEHLPPELHLLQEIRSHQSISILKHKDVLFDSDVDEIPQLVQALKVVFWHQITPTRSYEWRMEQLRQMQKMMNENSKKWCDAMSLDTGISPVMQAVAMGSIQEELQQHLSQLEQWMAPQMLSNPLIVQKPGRAMLVKEPHGVVLIMSAWTSSIESLFKPLIGAIAAGNCVIFRANRRALHVEKLACELIPQYLDTMAVRCVSLALNHVNRVLLQRPFDYTFFSGGKQQGHRVAENAARHLSPVTLMLSGQTPCLIDADVDLRVAVRRIVWAKFEMNCGQSHLAPDYVLVSTHVKQEFVELMKRTVVQFFGENAIHSKDYGRIIDERHMDHLCSLMDDIPQHKILLGGQSDREERYFAPTLVESPDHHSALMQKDILGPILPIIPVSDMRTAVNFILSKAKPPALYIFSNNHQQVGYVLSNTTSGSVCINDCMIQAVHPEIPLGSGRGANLNGANTYLAFTRIKGTYEHATHPDPDIRYPPYGERGLAWLRAGFNPFGWNAIKEGFQALFK